MNPQGSVYDFDEDLHRVIQLRICRINSARASFEEGIKDSITPGKVADFVALAEDPHDVEPDLIEDIPIVRTVVGGKTMYPIA